jgi:eukaryotic-like serine/threonine-protein kinase
MIGETLGSYVIEHAIGAGGMGEVFLGVHRRIGRRVAIKLLLPEYSASPALLGRFFTEARATSLIDHPGIVQILDCDVHPSGRAYIIMEYLHGESLRAGLRRVGRMVHDLPTVVSIVAQAAAAVGAAHEKGIVHRDLKPDNIFLLAGPRDRVPVKVLDFGVAKLMATEKDGLSNTRTGSLLGTPLYMSPEQCRSAGTVDHRSDVYSLGCICFEMVCGRTPFEGRGVTDLLIAHASHVPPPPSSLGIDLPGALEQLMMSMLAKDAADRPSTMAEVSSRLWAMVDRLPPAAQPFFVQSPSMAEVASRTAILPVPISPIMYSPAHALQTPRPPQTTLERSTGSLDTAERRPSRRGWAIGAIVSVAALAAGAYLFSDELIGGFHAQRRPSQDEIDHDPPTSSRPFEPPPTARGSGAIPPVVPAAPSLPSTVTVEVEGAPEGLRVTVDGDEASLPLRLPRDGSDHRLVFRAPGFQPETRIIGSSSSQVISLSLKPQKPAADSESAEDRPPTRAPKVPRHRPPRPPSKATGRGSDVITDI